MGRLSIREAPHPAVRADLRVDVLEVLALVLAHRGPGEAAHLVMRAERLRERGRPAPMKSADEDVPVPNVLVLRGFHGWVGQLIRGHRRAHRANMTWKQPRSAPAVIVRRQVPADGTGRLTG